MRKLSCIIQAGPKHDQMLPYERGRGNGDRDLGTGNMTTRLRLEVWRRQHLEKAKKWFSPETPERAQMGRFNFSPIKIISDSWPLQLWEITFLLLQVTKLMIICHSNHRKMNSGIITRELVTCKHTHIHIWFSHHQVNKFISVLALDIWVGPCKEETGRPCFANAARGMLAVVWGHGRHLA